jgi:hypothetical protein
VDFIRAFIPPKIVIPTGAKRSKRSGGTCFEGLRALTIQHRITAPKRILAPMDKKEIESPKLTANFLIWISAFMVLLFVLIAHFVWRVF